MHVLSRVSVCVLCIWYLVNSIRLSLHLISPYHYDQKRVNSSETPSVSPNPKSREIEVVHEQTA